MISDFEQKNSSYLGLSIMLLLNVNDNGVMLCICINVDRHAFSRPKNAQVFPEQQ